MWEVLPQTLGINGLEPWASSLKSCTASLHKSQICDWVRVMMMVMLWHNVVMIPYYLLVKLMQCILYLGTMLPWYYITLIQCCHDTPTILPRHDVAVMWQCATSSHITKNLIMNLIWSQWIGTRSHWFKFSKAIIRELECPQSENTKMLESIICYLKWISCKTTCQIR